MASNALPSSTSPRLALLHPSGSEKRSMRTMQAEVWRDALSVEAYIRREEHLGNQDATRDGGIMYWVLCDTAELVKAGQERRILASCETIRRKALVAYETGGVIQVKECLTYGVQRVFCNPEFRRQGYAKRMMKELNELLRGQEAGPGVGGASFSFLFSDIGKEFYKTFQWLPFRSIHISLPSIQPSQPTPDLPRTAPLAPTSFNSLCILDTKYVRDKLIESEVRPKVLAALIPDVQTMQWHHAREEFIANDLFGTKPDVKGAIVGEEEGRRAWCIWEHEWKRSARDEKELIGKLYILRLVVEGRNENNGSIANIAALIVAAQGEAAKWGLDVVELWDPTEEALQGAKLALRLMSKLQSNANLIQREKSDIASLQWHGGGLGLEGVCSGDVMWTGIEKYTWC
ncbi:MAG: hypothetical protein M1813_002061 [Trichoglossum hirsutum]|nr:MAG: hypothetical protein M1813_002061 [Trichoglossum hirsutum]